MGKKKSRMHIIEPLVYTSTFEDLQKVLDATPVKLEPLYCTASLNKGFKHYALDIAKSITDAKIQKNKNLELIKENDNTLSQYSLLVKFKGRLYNIEVFPLNGSTSTNKADTIRFCNNLESIINKAKKDIKEKHKEAKKEEDISSPYFDAKHLSGNVLICPYDLNPQNFRKIVCDKVPEAKFVNLYNAGALKRTYESIAQNQIQTAM
jgi:hypothetical protein